jgi:hypothetical protein
MCGYAASIIGAATTADQQGDIQILKMCNHSHSEFLCLFWYFLFKCFPMIIAAQALLRSSYRRCYAALSALLRSYYWRCYHGGSAEVAVKRGRGRLRRPCREEHEEKDTEKCKRNVLVFPVITALMSSLKLNPRISSAPMPAAHTFIRSISDAMICSTCLDVIDDEGPVVMATCGHFLHTDCFF